MTLSWLIQFIPASSGTGSNRVSFVWVQHQQSDSDPAYNTYQAPQLRNDAFAVHAAGTGSYCLRDESMIVKEILLKIGIIEEMKTT